MLGRASTPLLNPSPQAIQIRCQTLVSENWSTCCSWVRDEDEDSRASRHVNARPSHCDCPAADADCSISVPPSVATSSSCLAYCCVTTYVRRVGSTPHARSVRSSRRSTTAAHATTTQQTTKTLDRALMMSVTIDT